MHSVGPLLVVVASNLSRRMQVMGILFRPWGVYDDGRDGSLVLVVSPAYIEDAHHSPAWHPRDVAHRAGRPPRRGSRRSAVASRAGAAARRPRPSAAGLAGGVPRREATRSRSMYALCSFDSGIRGCNGLFLRDHQIDVFDCGCVYEDHLVRSRQASAPRASIGI